MMPDFLIIGAARAGTTTLYYSLKSHPGFFLPEIKEPRFFSFRDNPPRFINPASGQLIRAIFSDIDDYAKLFQEARAEQLLGEASTSYLYTSATTIRNIKELYGSDAKRLKIIAIIRNPIERTWSQYQLHRRDKIEPLLFEEAISHDVVRKRLQEKWPIGYDYIGFGTYSNQLRDFLDAFPTIKILLYDDLKKDSEQTVDNIFHFLGVDHSLRSGKVVKYNVTGVPKNRLAEVAANFIYQPNPIKQIAMKIVPNYVRYQARVRFGTLLFNKNEIPSKIFNSLSTIFEKDVRETGKLIGRNLDHWLKR
jgi:hypothetical protein